jgi:hypothetical protein
MKTTTIRDTAAILLLLLRTTVTPTEGGGEDGETRGRTFGDRDTAAWDHILGTPGDLDEYEWCSLMRAATSTEEAHQEAKTAQWLVGCLSGSDAICLELLILSSYDTTCTTIESRHELDAFVSLAADKVLSRRKSPIVLLISSLSCNAFSLVDQ